MSASSGRTRKRTTTIRITREEMDSAPPPPSAAPARLDLAFWLQLVVPVLLTKIMGVIQS